MGIAARPTYGTPGDTLKNLADAYVADAENYDSAKNETSQIADAKKRAIANRKAEDQFGVMAKQSNTYMKEYGQAIGQIYL